jgi:hypothetical protein
MSNERLYRENVLFALAEPEAFADRNAPTAAELNNATLVYNLTCSLWEDETEFTLGDPETDDGLTFCSKAGESTPLTDNPTVVFSALRDADRGASGIFNGAWERLAFPDSRYIAILRLGKDSDVAFAADDRIKMVDVATDHGVTTVSNGENVRIVQNFMNKGWVNWNYTVAS